MTAAERQAIREAVNSHVRSRKSRAPYRDLPSVSEARQMVSWVDCPVHGLKVGMDSRGHVVGRCSSCAEESAEAQLLIEARYV